MIAVTLSAFFSNSCTSIALNSFNNTFVDVFKRQTSSHIIFSYTYFASNFLSIFCITKWASPPQRPTLSLMRGLHTLVPPLCRFAAIYLIAACASSRRNSYVIKKENGRQKPFSQPYIVLQLCCRTARRACVTGCPLRCV